MALHRLTENDHAALHEAVALVKTVLDRHPHEMCTPIFEHFKRLVRDVHAIEGLLDPNADLPDAGEAAA